MERAGAGVPAVSDPRLESVAKAEGPFLSVYLSASVTEEDASAHDMARWSLLRRRLQAAGAVEAALEAVDRAVPGAHTEGASLGMVCGPDGDILIDHDVEDLPRDLGTWGPVPVLTPLIGWRQNRPPYVLVLLDRTGADVMGVRRDAPPVTGTAGGETWRASKTRGGAWAHVTMQRRVEETWSRNAHAVAAELRAMVARTGAELVLVAGEPKAVGMLRPLLERPVADLVHEVRGARQLEGPTAAVEDEVARWVRSAAAERTVSVLDAFHHHRGSHGRAADGAAATLAALRSAQVDVLLLHDPRLVHRSDGGRGDGGEAMATAWFDSGNPVLVAQRADELSDLGATPLEGPLVDVAVRAALASGAAVRLVPAHGGPADGLGALLRWSA